MKYFYVYICLSIIVISVLIYLISELYIVKKVTIDELEKESKKREEIVREIELLKSEKKDLDLSIENNRIPRHIFIIVQYLRDRRRSNIQAYWSPTCCQFISIQ